jgi:type I restriction-modification system DNA methylase subunit
MGELGQVFTPANVAQLMSELLLEKYSGERQYVLDPCIGENIFLKHLSDGNLALNGIEVDTGLIGDTTKAFYMADSRKLITGNFFDVTKKMDNKFDLIIENPPYVRQEKMTEENDKRKIRALFNHKGYKIPAKSNLYIYFLLRSIDLLKNQGKMVAIVYDSWLYSSYGESFKNTLSSLGSIESVIHFQSEAFTNADVGATIIEFRKGRPQTSKVRFAELENYNRTCIG